MRNFLLATALVMVSSAAVAQSPDPIVAYKLNGLGYLVGVRASGTLTSAGINSPPPALSFETPLAGTGSPGGSSGLVQYNNGGAFGGYTNVQLTALIQAAAVSTSGAVPAGGGTGKAWNPVDGWFTPAGGAVTSVAGRTGAVVLTNTDVAGSAPLASPALTGTPTAPTAAVGNNTTQVATTAFVMANQGSSGSGITGLTGDVTTAASSSGNGIAATLASSGVTPGQYDVVTVDAKGRVTAGQPLFQTLTYSATLAENVALGATASVTLTGNTTVSCPTNMGAGGSYQTRFVQDGTGSRVATWPACFKWPGGTPGVLSTAAGAVDVVTFTSFDGSTATAVISKAFQ